LIKRTTTVLRDVTLWQIITNVSDKPAASIFFLPSRKRQKVSPKCWWLSTELHYVNIAEDRNVAFIGARNSLLLRINSLKPNTHLNL
jgi:hypothetical protein